MSLELQSRDRDLVEVLTHRARALSVEQVERTWWGRGSERSLRRRLGQLQEEGLLERFETMAHPSPPLEHAQASWAPQGPKPDLRALANRLRRRWEQPLRPVTALVATRDAAERFGGSGGRRPRPSEVSHDLALAELFLRFRSSMPERAETWVSEASLAKAGWGREGSVLPDACLEPSPGSPGLVLELLGAYRLEKLERFHSFCEGRRYAYELW